MTLRSPQLVLAVAALAVPMARGVGQPVVVPNQRPGAEAAASSETLAPRLMVGDPAPALKIEQWLKGEPVAKLEAGKVYIVEFWATWCVPCARSIPHLTALETANRDRGLSVIGVASQEMTAADLERFVAKQGDRLGYRIALDDRGETNASWMVAAGQRGIPTAFLVDRQSRIAWIGHPMNGLTEALGAVLEGKHDLAGARAAWRARMELDAAAAPIAARYQQASDDGDHAAAIAAADELLALSPREYGEYAWKKFQVIALGMKDEPAAYAWAATAIGGPIKGNPEALTSLASIIAADPRLHARDLALARLAATQANTLTDGKRSSVLALLAQLAALQNDWAAAADWQARAVAAAEDESLREQLSRRLDEYKAKIPPP